MRIRLEMDQASWSVDLERAVSCAIEQRFDAHQPSAFGLPAARSAPSQLNGWVGDLSAGSPVRCHTVTLTPHDNGTHTESARHIGLEAPSPAQCVGAGLFPCALLRVEPTALVDSRESVRTPMAEEGDAVVTSASLQAAAARVGLRALPPALLIALQPPDATRASKRWGADTPYLTREAVVWLAESGVTHLLLELPSIDRLHDGGWVDNHRLWWSHPAPPTAEPTQRTITEMVSVPPSANEGLWLLHLSVAPWDEDAAPSHPWLLPLLPAPTEEIPP